jgi:integrase
MLTHGLRNAASRRLAEAGCSNQEIMAIAGHKTSQMVDHCAKAGMAASAIARLEKQAKNRKFQDDPLRLELRVFLL